MLLERRAGRGEDRDLKVKAETLNAERASELGKS